MYLITVFALTSVLLAGPSFAIQMQKLTPGNYAYNNVASALVDVSKADQPINIHNPALMGKKKLPANVIKSISPASAPAPQEPSVMDRVMAAGKNIRLDETTIPRPYASSPSSRVAFEGLQTASVPLSSVKPAANGPVFNPSLVNGQQDNSFMTNLPEIKMPNFKL